MSRTRVDTKSGMGNLSGRHPPRAVARLLGEGRLGGRAPGDVEAAAGGGGGGAVAGGDGRGCGERRSLAHLPGARPRRTAPSVSTVTPRISRPSGAATPTAVNFASLTAPPSRRGAWRSGLISLAVSRERSDVRLGAH